MFDILCVTNRTLCKGDFLARIEEIASASVDGIILREKDLSQKEYESLAKETIKICDRYNTPLILHSFVDVAIKLNVKNIHLPLPILKTLSDEQKAHFLNIGASCHSAEDAILAEKSGCTYITAGHVFYTDCKKDLAPRGLDFLKDVCESVSIPVYAIGGIEADKMPLIYNSGAKGGCVMSALMQCEDVKDYLKDYKRQGEKNV